ncbi:DNA polymerase subunit gamma-2, mitochondrial [Fundulus heteroclitus]|uniref:DNA polymerase subunit gamma-2, mitochondrial n=1 Tax=Fundulus heteroclitus TaxID=8078 RepID=UPI00165C5CA5|nr:DNA polymerase subunit gamma-2, mitochondrial [Fundulus heteroclitus]
MLAQGVGRCLLPPRSRPAGSSRGLCSAAAADALDRVRALLQLCADRHYICPGESNAEMFRRGWSCGYGPLGVELRRNLLQQWWHSMSGSRARVFAVDTPSSSVERGAGGARVVGSELFQQILGQPELSGERLAQELRRLLLSAPSLRPSLLQGALEQFVPSLEMVNRKLPFGLAEAGLCFQPSDGSGCLAEVNQTSLVWFCSPRTSSQWLDHWARHRLKWWRKFALSPSDFSSVEVPEHELEENTSRGMKILYNFPWGLESLETLWCRGDAELLKAYKGVRSKLQSRDGRKSIPHVVSVSGNMDRGVMAFLSNSLQLLRREDSKKRLQHRKVLKIHPVLAPVKVALDTGKGATMELRQVCEGLLQEFLEARISAWPGYLDTLPTSLEHLNAKYDEMGVLFTVVIGENTLESGLLQVRSRDTTIKETMHISEIRNFVFKYISAAEKF